MALEVEIKIRVDCNNINKIIEKLEKHYGATQKKAQIETDTYYTHPCRDFFATDEALRVRRIQKENDSAIKVTYKGPRIMIDKVKKRREVELKIAEGSPEELLEALGFHPALVVRKHRKYYETRNTIITVDKVDGLGCFVEIEDKSGNAENVKNLMESLGIRGEPVEESYAELMYKKMRGKG